MAARDIRPSSVVAVLAALTAALLLRSWLQLRLGNGGMAATLAADLSYLPVPAVLTVLLFPLWRREKTFLAEQFRLDVLNLRLILRALAIGLLIRVLWWCQLVAGISFGVYASADAGAAVGPVFAFRCSSPNIVLLGFFVMAVLVPLIEELVHRAYVQTAFARHGAFVSIVLASIVFALFHRTGSWPLVFLIGLVLGFLYWSTGSLWASVISHATYNALVQVDWRCLSGQWNPPMEDIPAVVPGISATALAVIALALLVHNLRGIATEAPAAPR
jgi:membrane protease YdiL (CAAX protease family)